MNLHDRNEQQIIESRTQTNRYYFWKMYGRNGTDFELLMHYIEHGGSEDFAKRVKDELEGGAK